MKVLVLTGSPRAKGNSNCLADAFCRGAEEAGHEVLRFDTAKLDIHPCLACDHCKREGICVHKDDMERLSPHIVEADAIALVTPLYYFGVCAQLKLVIDRFYGVNDRMRNHPKQGVLLATCGDEEEETMDALSAHFQALCHYCHWQDRGQVLALGVYDIGEIAGRPELDKAYDLGRSL